MTGSPALTVDGFDAQNTAEIANAIEHLDGNHHDSVLFVLRYGPTAAVDATDAWFTDVDPEGATVALQHRDGRRQIRLAFSPRIEAVTDFQQRLLAMLTEARASAPDHAQTSIERELEVTASLQTVVGSVKAVTPLTTNLLEVTVAGVGDLPVLGGDEFHYLTVPGPEMESPFNDGFDTAGSTPEDRQPSSAYYTARRRRPDEVDYWIVLHGAEGGVSGWANRAAVGQSVTIWGPRRSFEPPADTTHQLLVGDGSGIPAMAAIVEGQPVDNRITAVLETIDESSRPPFPSHPGLDLRWCFRGNAAPGTSGLLLETVRSINITADACYAFGAAESGEISAVRRHLRDERNLTSSQVLMTGYWRRLP